MSIRGINRALMKILGMIFDFNGVLVDDEPLHFQAFKQTLERAGWTLNWEEYRESYLPYDDKKRCWRRLGSLKCLIRERSKLRDLTE